MILYWRYFVDFFFALGLFINAILFIPQIIRLWRFKDPTGVSFITFAGFDAIQLFTIFHGMLVRDDLLTYGTFLSLITNTIVVLQIIYYRIQNKNSAISVLQSEG